MNITKLPPFNGGDMWDHERLMSKQTGPEAIVLIEGADNGVRKHCWVLVRLEHLETFWPKDHNEGEYLFDLRRIRAGVAEVMVCLSVEATEWHIREKFDSVI